MAWIIGMILGYVVGQFCSHWYLEYAESKGWGDFKTLSIGALGFIAGLAALIGILFLTGVITVTKATGATP